MKTICPSCKQEFPDTPDELTGTTVHCPVCDHDFIVRKAKYCSDCGAINPGQAVVCAKCGKAFPDMKLTPVVPVGTSHVFDEDWPHERISSAEMLSRWDKFGINLCVLFGILGGVVPVALMLHAIILDIEEEIFPFHWGPLLLLLPAPFSLSAAYWINMVTDPSKKIYWTPRRKIIIGTFCLLSLLFGICIVINTFVGGPKLCITGAWDFVWSIVIGCALCFGSVTAWRMFNLRAEEDVDFEESEEDIAEQRLKMMLKAACMCAVAGMFPVIGYVSLPIAIALLIVYKVKGGTDYIKGAIFCALAVVLQIIFFLYL